MARACEGGQGTGDGRWKWERPCLRKIPSHLSRLKLQTQAVGMKCVFAVNGCWGGRRGGLTTTDAVVTPSASGEGTISLLVDAIF